MYLNAHSSSRCKIFGASPYFYKYSSNSPDNSENNKLSKTFLTFPEFTTRSLEKKNAELSSSKYVLANQVHKRE